MWVLAVLCRPGVYWRAWRAWGVMPWQHHANLIHIRAVHKAMLREQLGGDVE